MCGIAGAYDVERGVARGDVEHMLGTLLHRGPDSWGVVPGSHGVIGQTRLAVIDLITGDPPITDDTGEIGATLNGEIYNYRALRAELLAEGRTLRTSGDTEVIAQLATTRDPIAVAQKLDGMFAAAVIDSRRERLVLLRDRLGKKPLYWWSDGRLVVFGSEIKAVLAHPAVPRRLADGAISSYLTFGYVPTPRTFFEGIQSLPPGHVLIADRAGIRTEAYWRPALPEGRADTLRIDADEAAAICRELLGRAVEKRLVADVPLGAFLSGGIDSSAVVALMASRTSHRVRTFSIGFDDAGPFDEREFARAVAERFGTEHHEFVVGPGQADLIERISWHTDQPFADASALPTFLLSELTRQHVTVALSGDGGDEVFAGYERFAGALLSGGYARVPAPFRNGALRAAQLLPERSFTTKASRFLARADLGLPDALRSWISYVPEEVVEELLEAPDAWALEEYRRLWGTSSGAPSLARILHLNLRTYLLDDLLVKVDRMSMAHGLEVRSPFLDPEVVSFGLRLPARLQLRGGVLKRVLKDSMRGLVPDHILDRGKRGFGVPLGQWFRGDLEGFLTSRLGAGAAVRQHLRAEAVDQLLREHATGTKDRSGELWSLLMLEAFLEREGW